MARIPASGKDRIYTISKWLGVNESADGDIGLRMGEAAVMRNFKITDDFSLQKRPGTQNVAGLLASYTVTVSDTPETLFTEINAPSWSFTAKPSIEVNAGGVLSYSGDSVTIDKTNISSYTNYYYKDNNNQYWKVGGLELVQTPGDLVVEGGTVKFTVGGERILYPNAPSTWTTYSGLKVSNGQLSVTGAGTSGIVVGNYFQEGAYIYKILGLTFDGYFYRLAYQRVEVAGDDVYNWKFYRVTASSNTTDTAVRGIWSGRIGTTEYIVAACNGHLWSLSESGGVWTKIDLGTLDTSKPVHFFGFGNKLYILNGSEYYSWDGTSLTTVQGYRPLVSVSVPPEGGGESLERVNMLNGQRRVWCSPDGTATMFTLPEKDLASVDYVKVIATGELVSIASSNLKNGTVTLSEPPKTGTNTIEIGYSVPQTLRTNITKMTHSELYNGVSDNRVFVYGDGTNKAYYSDLDYNGQATAEYFPDLNVVHFGDANTPLTSMVRHYDRLLAFKTDSAYSVAYDTVTLPGGKVTAGFYVTAINKGLGSAGYGQAVIVGNQPRTLDGGSIYEWTPAMTAGAITTDHRNARRISQKVQQTMREIDIETAITYHDKVYHEYYVVDTAKGIAVVQNTEHGAWYVYRNFPASCMIVYKDELYIGTAGGDIRHVSRKYMHDVGSPIACYWESGSMDFGAGFIKKYSDLIWIVLKPEDDAAVFVTIQTDNQNEYGTTGNSAEVATGFFDFLKLNFEHFTFNVNDKPQTQRRKIKVKNFAWYKLIFSTVSNNTTATVLSTSVRVRQMGYVR